MKNILVILLCSAMFCSFAGCSERSSDDAEPDTEHTGNAPSGDEYVFVKTVTGYSGSSVSVTSALLDIYRKDGSYYAKAGKSRNYAVCSRNSGYSSSYSGSDPKKKYRYCAKPATITYYFNL